MADYAHSFFVVFFFFVIVIFSFPSLFFALEDDEALLQLKDSMGNTRILDNSWKAGTHPCEKNRQWFGIQCHNVTITGLRLNGLGLSGEIKVEVLSSLKGLRMMAMANNSFSGSIPGFNKLGALRSIFIHENKFSGEIPPDFFSKMTSLKKVWLSNNGFSGEIPDSFGRLPNLIELHLEENEFSGRIPSMAQKSLTTLDMSKNKLEGEIPPEMERFGRKPFEGNLELCGKLLGKNCPKTTGTNSSSEAANHGAPKLPPPPPPPDEPNTPTSSPGTKWVVLSLVVAFLTVSILFQRKNKEDSFGRLEKENLDEVVPVHIASTNRRTTMSGSIRKGSRSESSHGGSKRGGSQSGRSMGDLVIVNHDKGVFGLPDLMKAAAEVLGNGGMGSAYKAVMVNGVSVVVKRLREINKISRDNFDAEMRRLGSIKHPNILTPLAYHYRKEEKLFISEYIPKGSLLYMLHGDRGISHAELNWPTRLRIIRGVASGMAFLHNEFASYDVPHGNLKSSNILLTSGNDPLLNDYAYYPLVNNTSTAQSMFAFRTPEGILHRQISPKSDVYCLGVVVLEVMTGKFPSQYLNNQKGGTDVVEWVRHAVAERREAEVIDPEISGAAAGDSVPLMERLLHIGCACTETDLIKRLDMKEAIRRIEDVKV
ncbi:hypothetical protein DM860_014254 [Cuscuta australis]|uniref:Protein kinase domain-containing protein n=1 Tax=Cuscuta australis TaxID=267555 RepID=A0A328DIB4_9ASTE|nr:hypothetical protein DM860_014254 [Cuscuta australis]